MTITTAKIKLYMNTLLQKGVDVALTRLRDGKKIHLCQ